MGDYIYRYTTAKSDQRFDANRRSKIGTRNEDNKLIDKGKEKDSIEEIEKKSLDPKDELKILKNWGLLKKTIVVGNVIDPLIEKGIFTPQQWMLLKKSHTNDADLVEEFLYIMLKSPPEAYTIFMSTIKARGYNHVANQLEGTAGDELSVSSGGSVMNRNGRPQGSLKTISLLSSPVGITDPRNGATGAMLMEVTQHLHSNTVKQEDLTRMKDEITDELRQLRENIEKDRDQDRLELKLLQRKHTELQNDLVKATDNRQKLQNELSIVTETVKILKEQIEEKQSEYKQVRDKNKELEQLLEKKAGNLEKQLQQKEKEKEELSKQLKMKEEDYKHLQIMLEKLKEEHEERHVRLKAVIKDKCFLEKELQILGKDRKNLEVKIRSLEQHIRVLQEAHFRETEGIKQQLEKQKTLLEVTERERVDLEKKLEESVRENESLKRTNLDLEDNLQKCQNEKVHLQQRLKQSDLTKYALPPFLVGNKSTRTGWNPKNLRRH